MNPIVCASGWCAFSKPRHDSAASQAQYKTDYLSKIWRPYIEHFIKPDKYHIYVSRSEIDPIIDFDAEVIQARRKVTDQPHSWDWLSSVMTGAMYSLCNECDMVFIEQDCLVYGLDKALEWAQGKKICYGFGDNCSRVSGWAEHSFMYVSHEYLNTFINKTIDYNCPHEGPYYPEMTWQILFKDDASYWPFGHGAIRPIDYTKEIFFLQQINDNDLNIMLKKISKEKGNE